MLFSRVAVPIYIPAKCKKGVPFLHILPTSTSILFDDRPSDRCEVLSHCGFDLHFPDD